jgi:hypothetical protein
VAALSDRHVLFAAEAIPYLLPIYDWRTHLAGPRGNAGAGACWEDWIMTPDAY